MMPEKIELVGRYQGSARPKLTHSLYMHHSKSDVFAHKAKRVPEELFNAVHQQVKLSDKLNLNKSKRQYRTLWEPDLLKYHRREFRELSKWSLFLFLDHVGEDSVAKMFTIADWDAFDHNLACAARIYFKYTFAIEKLTRAVTLHARSASAQHVFANENDLAMFELVNC